MALPVWPEGLSEWLEDGYQSKADPSVVRSEMNSSLVRQRRRFSQAVHVKSVSILCTKTEFAVFYNFWRDTLSHGSGSFLGPVWHNAVSYVQKVCQIVDGAYSDEPMGPELVRVSFQLRVVGL